MVQSTLSRPTVSPSPASRPTTAENLYSAECALHAAHQSHVEEWIIAASERLHVAVAAHEKALLLGH